MASLSLHRLQQLLLVLLLRWEAAAVTVTREQQLLRAHLRLPAALTRMLMHMLNHLLGEGSASSAIKTLHSHSRSHSHACYLVHGQAQMLREFNIS